MRPRRNGPAPDINVTPLVDVVLVLLIIFMVIAPKMDDGPELELPKIVQAEARSEAASKPLQVSVTADGDVWLDEQAVERDRTLDALKAAYEADPARRVVIRGDRRATYASVRGVFRHCQDLGFKGVALQVVERGGT